MKPATSWVMRTHGFRRVLVVNGLLVAAGFALCATLTAGTPVWWTSALLFVSGLSRSMQFTALNTLGFADVPKPAMTGATTLFSACQQLNAGLGIAFRRGGAAHRRNGSAATARPRRDRCSSGLPCCCPRRWPLSPSSTACVCPPMPARTSADIGVRPEPACPMAAVREERLVAVFAGGHVVLSRFQEALEPQQVVARLHARGVAP